MSSQVKQVKCLPTVLLVRAMSSGTSPDCKSFPSGIAQPYLELILELSWNQAAGPSCMD